MTKRTMKALALVASGGAAFQFGLGFGGFSGCATNASLTNFYTSVGSNAISTVTDPARAIGSDFEQFVVDPTTNILQDWWSVFVQTRIPSDPVFTPLLAN